MSADMTSYVLCAHHSLIHLSLSPAFLSPLHFSPLVTFVIYTSSDQPLDDNKDVLLKRARETSSIHWYQTFRAAPALQLALQTRAVIGIVDERR